MTNKLKEMFIDGFDEHAKIHTETALQCLDSIIKLTLVCENAIQNGNKIIFAGNGGSAADAQHLATELTIRYEKNRPPIASISLATDTSALTACGNDFGFSEVFSRQLEALGKPGDVFIGITTSGKSENIIKAFEKAKNLNITTCCFTGQGGKENSELADIIIAIPSYSTARIQEQHILLGHLLCKGLELNLV